MCPKSPVEPAYAGPLIPLALSLSALLAGCDGQNDAAAAASATAPVAAETATVDPPMADWQRQLIDLVAAAAARMPADPHQKNRSRVQGQLVDACVAIGQLAAGATIAAGIADWRQGTAFGELAMAHARRGDAGRARELLRLARQNAIRGSEAGTQEWRIDQILARVAAAAVLLGDDPDAAVGGAMVPALEPLVAARLERLPPDAALDHLATVAPILRQGDLDQVTAALRGCVVVARRFWDDPAQRQRSLQPLRRVGTRVPGVVLAEVLMSAAALAADRGAGSVAAEFAGLAGGVLDRAPMATEDRLAARARLAGLRFRAGETREGLAELSAVAVDYERLKTGIVDIQRAGVLRALALGWQACGERDQALLTFRQAVAAGVANPNSRPRLDDLAATVAALLGAGFEPDAALLADLRKVADGLGHPW